MKLNQKQEKQVKTVARDLLAKLKKDKLVLDWRKKQQTRAAVKLTIDEMLDKLPEVYTREKYTQKCGAVYQHFYESYIGPGESIYSKLHQN
jgi:type I restriction enzyme R subunit